jgi:hypothetical protein
MGSRLQSISFSGIEVFRGFERWLKQDQQRFTQFFIIPGVLLTCSIVLYLIPVRYLWIPSVAVLALGALILYLRLPPVGLLALVFITLYVPFEVAGGVAAGIHIPLLMLPLILGVWLIDKFVRLRNLEFVTSRPLFPLFGFAIVAILSFAIGQFPWFVYAKSAPIASQLAGLAIMILSVAGFFLSANLMTDVKWLKRLTWLFIFLGSFFVIGRLIPTFGLVLSKFMPRGIGGSMLWTWLAVITFSQAFLNQKISGFWRVILFALTVGLYYSVIVLTYNWKSGWVPALAVAAVIIWLRFPRLGVALGIVGLFFLQDIPSQIISSDEYSYSTRLEAWRIILSEIVKVNPLFGLGPSNYYYYTPLFPILGYAVEFNSHNNFVDLLAQTGILGLVFFLWFAWEMARLAWRLWKELPPGFSRAYAGGILAGIAGILVAAMLGDWVIPFIYNVGLTGFRASLLGWIFMGGLVGIDWMNKKAKETERNDS